ncbi:predicted protein [Lichtheimia corymbifera JMRC:FSU:9682]|uniref:Uncharacterized protein n=1 Tax=Lichtheimia corymbifera JMRC:FSU:9682 TaxID=1263082 RepID=A0A068RSY0_9FUNG|nr:predicted protein [Lichtheimia corymbifera JMRC:FSU:9682]
MWEKVGSALLFPEIAHLEPETFTQHPSNHAEQFRSHKVPRVHYENPCTAVRADIADGDLETWSGGALGHADQHRSHKASTHHYVDLEKQAPLCFYICCKRDAI